jgi:hypothetical protein
MYSMLMMMAMGTSPETAACHPKANHGCTGAVAASCAPAPVVCAPVAAPCAPAPIVYAPAPVVAMAAPCAPVAAPCAAAPVACEVAPPCAAPAKKCGLFGGRMGGGLFKGCKKPAAACGTAVEYAPVAAPSCCGK